MNFIALLHPTDIAGQRTGIGRVDIPADQGHAEARHWIHTQTFQYGQMAVTATDEQQLFNDRGDNGCFHGYARRNQEI